VLFRTSTPGLGQGWKFFGFGNWKLDEIGCLEDGMFLFGVFFKIWDGWKMLKGKVLALFSLLFPSFWDLLTHQLSLHGQWELHGT
jgi:hypothetical protein